MAAAGHPLDATAGPVITNFPIWLAESQRIPALALPDESPTDVLDLAHDPAFAGTHLLVIVGEGHGRWPAVLDTATDGAACFRELDLGPGPSGPTRSARGRPGLRGRLPMNDDPYTPKSMEAARSEAHAGGDRFDGLHAEATAAVGQSAYTLRRLRERYREAYDEKLARWQTLRDDLERLEGGRVADAAHDAADPTGGDAPEGDMIASTPLPVGIDERRTRVLRQEVDRLVWELADHQAELGRLDLGLRTLERTRRFLERGDETLVTEPGAPTTNADIAMRIVEAAGGRAVASRAGDPRRAGPGLSNAIFQVEFIERVMATDPRLAGTELATLRELLRRELGDVRTFISQLRPPLLDELGLDGGDRRRRRACTRRDDRRHHDRARRRRPTRLGEAARDRRPARRPGGTAECPQARSGDDT